MRISSPFFGFKAKAIALSAAVIIITHLAANVTLTNAQQQEPQQLSTSQPTTSSVTQNGTTATTVLFENTKDSFRVQLPEGWVIQNVNNTGFALAAEVTEGYGILTQLCPEEEEGQQQGALTNVSSSRSGSCQQQQQAQKEIIHIIRYPNLGARLGFASDDGVATTNNSNITPDIILAYQMQKLQEVGYRDIGIVNITDTTMNVISTGLNNNVIANVPAKLVEMTYSTNFAPSEIRTGYLISTATDATPRNFEVVPSDPHGFDGNDNDGIGCESGSNQPDLDEPDNNSGST